MVALRKVVALAAVCVLGACASRDSGARIPEMVLDEHVLVTSERTPTTRISPENDGLGFAIAVALHIDPARRVVLENGNGRLVLFDHDWRAVRYIGHKGAGPGELRGAAALAVWRDEYAVSEVNNARVTVFREDGAFLRAIPLPNGLTEVAYAPDGTLFVSAHDGKNYLLAIDRRGVFRPFAERPWDLYPDEVLKSPRPPIRGHNFFAVTDSGTVHIYDATLGALVKLDPMGRRVSAARLPRDIRRGLREREGLTLRDFGGSAADAEPSITGLSVTSDGRLLLLFPNVGVIGLLVDPTTYHAQAIRWGPEMNPRLGGFSGVVYDGLFYRLDMDGIRIFALRPE